MGGRTERSLELPDRTVRYALKGVTLEVSIVVEIGLALAGSSSGVIMVEVVQPAVVAYVLEATTASNAAL